MISLLDVSHRSRCRQESLNNDAYDSVSIIQTVQQSRTIFSCFMQAPKLRLQRLENGTVGTGYSKCEGPFVLRKGSLVHGDVYVEKMHMWYKVESICIYRSEDDLKRSWCVASYTSYKTANAVPSTRLGPLDRWYKYHRKTCKTTELERR